MSRKNFLFVSLIFIVSLLLTACGAEKPKYTIGVVSEGDHFLKDYDSFKTKMAELGYIESENITYIFNGTTGTDPEKLDREIKDLLAQDVDLLLTMGNAPTSQAKKAVEGTDIPVIFAPFFNPVEEGIVESMTHPGGNLTGVRVGIQYPKALEWLFTLAPASKVYIPYPSNDEASAAAMPELQKAASALGVEVVTDEVKTPEEVLAAFASLPKDTDVFLAVMPSLESGLADYGKAALKHGIAIGASHPAYMIDGVLVNYMVNSSQVGQKAARLADKVLHGTVPADLPIEQPDGILTINLKTANAIGLEIPDNLLSSANNVIR